MDDCSVDSLISVFACARRTPLFHASENSECSSRDVPSWALPACSGYPALPPTHLTQLPNLLLEAEFTVSIGPSSKKTPI
jgi:hypothetical protein